MAFAKIWISMLQCLVWVLMIILPDFSPSWAPVFASCKAALDSWFTRIQHLRLSVQWAFFTTISPSLILNLTCAAETFRNRDQKKCIVFTLRALRPCILHPASIVQTIYTKMTAPRERIKTTGNTIVDVVRYITDQSTKNPNILTESKKISHTSHNMKLLSYARCIGVRILLMTCRYLVLSTLFNNYQKYPDGSS